MWSTPTIVALTLLLACFEGARSHGAVTWPPPRNAIDSNEEPWRSPVPAKVPFEPWCPFPSASAAVSDPGRNLTGMNGQACFWFSNGCGIDCETCDGSTRGPIPAFEGNPLKPVPNHVDSGTGKPVKKEPICPDKKAEATICDASLRTVNTDAECGSENDFFYYSPWRKPGSAAVLDACGIAGGRVPGQGPGGYGAQYVNTTHALLGDRGTMLPSIPSSVVWKSGSVQEVSWALQANHGGGYSYRLCALDDTDGGIVSESCFQNHPLDFVGSTSSFRWGGKEGRVEKFNATYVKTGTVPEGSMWAKNPVPRAWRLKNGQWAPDSNHLQTGVGFQPLCENVENYTCTGMWGPYNLEIVDRVQIPSTLKPGSYVLGWRWDCEESNQIWSSCSDITIVA